MISETLAAVEKKSEFSDFFQLRLKKIIENPYLQLEKNLKFWSCS
jgi:hypothetical protein